MMSEQESTDVELENRLQDHFAKHYGEVRRPGDLWDKLSPSIRPNNGMEPQRASQYSASLPQGRSSERAQRSDWLPLPAGYKPRRSASWLPRAVGVAAALTIGLFLVWLLSSVRLQDKPIAATPVAATPTVIAGQVITTVRAIEWGAAGNTWAYETGIDDRPDWAEPAAYIKSGSSEAQGAGALQRGLSVERYRGQRLRFTASVMAESVEGYAGLWMRINDSDGVLLISDEMRDRAIVGSSDWQQYEVVMDVPPEALIATFGVQIEDRGGVWIREARLSLVDKSVATTGAPPPYNLGFEAGLSSWNPSNTKPGNEHTKGIDKNVSHSGQASAFIDGTDSSASGPGIIVQHFPAYALRGKRVRISGYLKSQDLDSWGGLYAAVRENTGSTMRTLAFDNTENRPISGTTEWQRFEMILDVPEQATGISFGALNASHSGRLWLDDFTIEEVDENIPITGYTTQREARNLGFETGLEYWYALAGKIIEDRTIAHSGQASARLEAINAPAGTHAFLAHNFITEPYSNRRVRISAYVKTEDVAGKATLQASVADVRLPEVFASVPITGTNDWMYVEVVARVPEEPGRLQIDLLLEGRGTVWLDDVQIEVIE